MATIVIQWGLSARRSFALLTLAWVGIASLGPVLRAEAQAAMVSGTSVPGNTVIATIAVGNFPDCLAISPDSQTVYVANSGSNSVTVIDVAVNYAVEATVTIPNNINFLALSPDGKTLFVSEEPQGSGPGVVEVYNVTIPASPSLMATVTAGYYPKCMAVSPDGEKLYVANGNTATAKLGQSPAYEQNPGAVYVFDTANYKQNPNIIVTNGAPFQVLFTNNGKQVEVLNETGPGFIQFIDTATGTVSSATGLGGRIFRPAGMIINTGAPLLTRNILCVADSENYVTVLTAKTQGAPPNNTNSTTNTILAVGSEFDELFLGQPALTADGRYLYVPYGGGRQISTQTADIGMIGQSDQVAMIDVLTGTLTGSLITVGNDPVWAQASPDGNTLYVCNASDGTVSVIDIRSN